jgi:tetratricopeptide (TPR) repeat protein
MANLLVSFCNVFPPGLGLGLYNFESDDYTWIDISIVSEACLGVDGICWRDNSFWVLLQLAPGGVSGLVMIDSDLNVRRSYKLTNTRDAHSLIPYQDGFFVTDTMRNRLNFVYIDSNGVLHESEYWRYCDEQTDVVHLNSVAQLNGDVYVSVFGPKPPEGWAFAANGQIINVSKNKVICDGLAHPHTLMEVEGMLYWLESRKGLVHRFSERDGHQIVLHLDGYLRGLTYDDKYLYVAASALRRRSRSTGVMSLPPSENPEDLHSWIYRIDRKTLQPVEKRKLTAFGAEIYDLAIVKQNRPSCYPQAKKADAVVQRIWKYEDEYFKLKDLKDIAEQSLRHLLQDLVDSGEWQKAIVYLPKLLERYLADAHFEYLLALCLHMQREDIGKALDYYNLALEHGFNEFWVRYNRGSLYMELGNFEQARLDLERAVELNPEHSDARRRLEELSQRIGGPQPGLQPGPPDLQAQLAEKDRIILSLQQQVSQLSDKIKTLEDTLKEKEDALASLRSQLTSIYNSRRWKLATWLAVAYWKIRKLLNFANFKRRR